MWSFLIGFGLGFTGAVLLTPKSGQETRGYLGSAATGSVDYVRRQTAELRESALDMVERGQNILNRRIEQMSGRTAENPSAVMYQR